MAESLNEIITQQRIRSYEISIWTLQDRFLSVLKWSTMDLKGLVQDPEVVLRDDGTEELTFTIPKFYYSGVERILNPMWLHLKDLPLEANMHKLKVIFNKNYEDERVFEFLVTSVASDHTLDRIDINVKAEGLAFHELGKVGYKIALSQENYELELEKWIKRGMRGEKPRMNILYWNDLIFKDSNGNWRTNWQYEVRMDWSSYSQSNGQKDSSCVYEDEYVSSWLLDANEKLMPRYTEGFKEKWRPVEIKESNIYNATLTIAEQFGVFCRYEYEHDENYLIIGKKVIYYNNYLYDKEGHIDLTYPYSSSGITRTIDNSSVTTKMFVTNVEEDSTTISIMDVEANKSREDYLLCFDYLKNIEGINEDLYKAIQDYEAKMYKYNTSLSGIQERIRVLTDLLILLEADYTTYSNAYKLDDERYNEAVKSLNSITGGKAFVPVDTSFTVMEDNKNGLGLYIRMRFEGMVLPSIKLYAKNNFTSLNGSLYSEPVFFSPKYDDLGELTYLYNLLGNNLTAGSTVYLSGERDPYSYYKTLKEIWELRKNIDEEKRDEAEEKTELYNWYLYGSRVDYGLVGSARVSEAYYGIMTTAPFDGTEEELAIFDMVHPYVSWYVGFGRAGRKGEIYDYNDEYDHFELEDKDDETADLYYFLEYFLKQKELEYNRLERMLGPALREGYWTPEDYHDYGDLYEASFLLGAGKSEVADISHFNDFITGSMVYALSPDAILAPHLLVLWDCNKYYDNEEPLIYTSSISDNKDLHLIIDLTDYMDIVREHLDDLCLFYSSLPVVLTIDDISGEASDIKSYTDSSGKTKYPKLIAVKESLNLFKDGQYKVNSTVYNVNSNYYSKLLYFINANPIGNNMSDIFLKANEGLNELRGKVNEFALKKIPYTGNEENEDQGLEYVVDSLTDIAESIYNLQQVYTKIKEGQTSETAINLANEELEFLEAAYKYLMGDDASIYNWDELILDPKAEDIGNNSTKYWSINDRGLLVYIRQYLLYLNWIESLKENCNYSFQINSLAELGWILDAVSYTDNNNITKYNRFPALIVTGAKTLDEDTIRLIVTNKYTIEDIDGNKITRTISNNKYKPFLGYYELQENGKGPKVLNIKSFESFPSLKLSDFIGTESTEHYTRTLKSYDYDGDGKARLPRVDEYRYRRVFPRLFFNTIKLKNTSSDLYVNVNGNTLDSFKDYSVVTDDRSVGQRTLGVGYYLTLKAPVLFLYGNNEVKIDISYTVSNSDVAIYLDAIKVMRENAYPKVSYDVELSVLNPEFVKTAYNRLNLIVHINDNDLLLEEVSGYISTVTLKLDKPWEDTVEIKNYETKFEDLFTTIVALTEAMKKSSQGLDTALLAFSRTTGLIDSDVLYNSMLNTDLNLSFNQGTLTIDLKEGIWGTSENGVVAFRGGGIFTATEHDSNGNWIWNTGILPSGINASLITTGQLDTNKIKVFAGDLLRFLLNGEGLYAYKVLTTESSLIDNYIKDSYPEYITSNNNIDSHQYVVFNSNGLFLTAESGTIYTKEIRVDSKTGNSQYIYDMTKKDVNRVEVSWKGLILRNWNGEDVFYADNTGNLTLKGTIQATSGNIAGWTILSDSLLKEGIGLYSNTLDSGPGIVLADKQLQAIETVIGDTPYYVYKDKNNINLKYYLNNSSITEITLLANLTVYVYQLKIISVEPKYQISSATVTGGTLTSNDITDGVIISNSASSVETTIYVGENSSTPMLYNGESIAYDFTSDPDETINTWYKKVKLAKGNAYKNYVNEVEGHEYIPITVRNLPGNNANSTLILLPELTGKPTFSVYARSGETTIKSGTIGNFTIEDNALRNGTLINTKIENSSYFVANGEIQKFDKLFYDIKSDPDNGVLTLTRINGQQVNFNIAAMPAYKNAIAAASLITLKLESLDGVVIATATNSKGVTVTKLVSISDVGSGTITATATSGNGVKVTKLITITDGGVPNINNTTPAGCSSGCTNDCKGGCGQTCKEKCKTSCGNACQKGCGGNCINECRDDCTARCTGTCQGTCYGGCGNNCINMCQDDCTTGCRNGCQATCYTGCKNSCTGGCKNTAKSGGGCFIPSTLITLSNKQAIPIFKVTEGMELMAYDEVQKKFTTTIVTSIMKFNKKDIIDIILLNGDKVTTTLSHPFLTKEGWKSVDTIMGQWEHNIKVQQLQIGDFILTENNEFVEIINIINRTDLNNTDVYNIDVTDYSTYIANGLIVHNADKKQTQ